MERVLELRIIYEGEVAGDGQEMKMVMLRGLLVGVRGRCYWS